MKNLTIDVPAWLTLVRETGADIPVSFMVSTGSMKPLIRPGTDIVTVYPVKKPLKVGDIVLFERLNRTAGQSEYCLHRICRMTGDTVTVRGDNCKFSDAPIPVSAVAGIAVSVLRNGKTIRLDTEKGRNAMLLPRMIKRLIRYLLLNCCI